MAVEHANVNNIYNPFHGLLLLLRNFDQEDNFGLQPPQVWSYTKLAAEFNKTLIYCQLAETDYNLSWSIYVDSIFWQRKLLKVVPSFLDTAVSK